MWYDEVKDYDFNAARFGMNTGHFTQVVWKGTTELGCGIALGRSWIYGVCHYGPPGNVIGAFRENVLPK
jgi:hypothetical protein